MDGPVQLGGQGHDGGPGLARDRPRQPRPGAVQLHGHVGPEVPGEPDRDLSGRLQGVDDGEAPAPGVERHLAHVLDGHLEPAVAVVPRRPAEVRGLAEPAVGRRRPRLRRPQERAARHRLVAPPTRACCGRGSSGSSSATRARRGSSRCRDRRGCRRRRAGPRRDSASAWACAAIDRKPCGPPSHRHQISGRPRPASAAAPARRRRSDAAARCGRPVDPAWPVRRARPAATPRRSAAARGHQSQAPNSAAPARQQRRPSGSRSGRRAPARGPRRRRPAAAARPATSSDGASGVEASRASSCQVLVAEGVPAASASAAATSASSSDEAVVVGGQLAVQPAREGVAPRAGAPAGRRPSRASASLSVEPGEGARRARAARRPRRRRGCWPTSPG